MMALMTLMTLTLGVPGCLGVLGASISEGSKLWNVDFLSGTRSQAAQGAHHRHHAAVVMVVFIKHDTRQTILMPVASSTSITFCFIFHQVSPDHLRLYADILLL
jgi:hypothetical protein